jgi:hypothetical protein
MRDNSFGGSNDFKQERVTEHMKKIKFLLIMILIGSLSACSTLAAIFEPEYDTITHQGVTYIQEWKWIPLNELQLESVDVSLNFEGRKIDNQIYQAKAYSNDDQTVFLYRNGLIFTKSNYVFPDPTGSDLIIDHLDFINDRDQKLTISDPVLIAGIIESVNQPSTERSSCQFVEPHNYEIIVFYKDYFASYDLGSICDDASGRFGLRDFSTGGKATALFSQTLNDLLKDKLEK